MILVLIVISSDYLKHSFRTLQYTSSHESIIESRNIEFFRSTGLVHNAARGRNPGSSHANSSTCFSGVRKLLHRRSIIQSKVAATHKKRDNTEGRLRIAILRREREIDRLFPESFAELAGTPIKC